MNKSVFSGVVFSLLLSLSSFASSSPTSTHCKADEIKLRIIPTRWRLGHHVEHYNSSSEFDGWVTYEFQLNENYRPTAIELVDRSELGKHFEYISERNLKKVRFIDECKINQNIDKYLEDIFDGWFTGHGPDYRKNMEHLIGKKYEITFNYKYDVTFGDLSASETRKYYADNLFKIKVID
ncbi:hypothetical protein [Thalassotalea hakodatensis]|uniref:hypothetical protein n=1 Tax=Thalassotalea hakodatensis TaxID=3030492 RepID=UPI002572F31E|nr:hypothetical protein [Thalassotalea hakodatensis]